MTPGSRDVYPDDNVLRVSMGARAMELGYKTVLKAGDPQAVFCSDPSPNVAGKIEIHFIDLYNRNPTSSDNEVQLREAWLRFGQRYDGPTELAPGTSAYVLAGKAPRFSRQRTDQSWLNIEPDLKVMLRMCSSAEGCSESRSQVAGPSKPCSLRTEIIAAASEPTGKRCFKRRSKAVCAASTFSGRPSPIGGTCPAEPSQAVIASKLAPTTAAKR